jgi:hypothetical protein
MRAATEVKRLIDLEYKLTKYRFRGGMGSLIALDLELTCEACEVTFMNQITIDTTESLT